MDLRECRHNPAEMQDAADFESARWSTIQAGRNVSAVRPHAVVSTDSVQSWIGFLTDSDYTLVAPPEAPRRSNTGDNDVSTDGTPSQFLLLRGLEASVTEEVLAKGVAKLYRPANSQAQTGSSTKKGAKVASTTGDSNLGARDGSLRRVLLVRDRRSNDSWRYGFAELATVGVRTILCFLTNIADYCRMPKRP